MSDYKLLVFDWDGTLSDSIGRIVEAMQGSALDMGLEPRDARAVKGIIGLALPEAISTLHPQLDDAGIVAFRGCYAERYIALEAEPSPLYEGVVESLEVFREQGYRLAVATGKARRGLDRVLKAHGWEDYFDITRAADETRSKPHPLMLEQILDHCQVSAEQALMVGDSVFDLRMAHNAGMASIAVGYGALSLDELRLERPLHAIERFPELQAWLGH